MMKDICFSIIQPFQGCRV